ncbi:MAG TPA: hypothetical protein VNY09_08750, partial [Candidatus Sulfotelmatobacter sp.]|nr:hypothetical protein [Candidatus Sulfotelmatobacter sp.]
MSSLSRAAREFAQHYGQKKSMKGLCALRWLAFVVAILVLTPAAFAQTGASSNAAKTQGLATSLSHDLSGVWMQYPDGDVPGVPGMNAVSNRTRPPLTPWGQAKFDAAKPLVGPRAIPGEENNPELRCYPDGPPKL